MRKKYFFNFLAIFVMAIGLARPAASPSQAFAPTEPDGGRPPSAPPANNGSIMKTVFVELAVPDAPQRLAPDALWRWYQQQRDQALVQLQRTLKEYQQRGMVKSFTLEADAFGVKIEAAPQVFAELTELGLIGGSRDVQANEIMPNRPGASWSPPLLNRAEQARRQAEAQAQSQRMSQDAGEAQNQTLRSSRFSGAAVDTAALSDPRRDSLRETPQQPDDIPPVTRGHFQVMLFYDYIYGYTINDSAAFTVTVEQGGALIASKQGVSQSYGYYSLNVYDYYPDNIFMPGAIVRVQEAGQPETTLTIPDIRAQVNTQTNIVSGQAPASQTIHLRWCDNGCFYQDVIADSGGAYTADFTGLVDITYRGYGYLYYADPASNNLLYTYLRPPQLEIRVNAYYSYGYSGATSAVPASFRMRLLNPDGSQIQEIYVTDVDYDGWFYAYWDEILEPGRILEMTTPAGEIVSMVIPPLSLLIDPYTDTASGTGPASSAIHLDIYHITTGDFYTTTVTDAGGNYSVFTGGTFDIQRGDYGWAYYDLPDGNYAEVFYRVPYVTVSTYYHEVWGYVSPYAQVTAYLYDSANNLKAQGTDYAYEDGRFYVYFQDNQWNTVEVLAGDRVVIESSLDATQEITVPDIQASADLDTDTINGYLQPNTSANVDICRPQELWDDCWEWTVSSGADGFFSLTPDDFDIQPGYIFYITDVLEGGNMVETGFPIAHLVEVDLNYTDVGVRTRPGAFVEVIQRDSYGVPINTYAATAGYQGWVYFYAPDMIAGQYFDVTSRGPGEAPDYTSQVNIANLGIDHISRSARQIEGHGPANTTLYLEVYGDCYFSGQITTDANGYVQYTFPNWCRMQGGNRIYLGYLTPPNSRQIVWSMPPGLRVYYYNNRIYGYASPGQVITLIVKDSGGNVKESTQIELPMSSYSFGYYPNTTLLPGDSVELHTGGEIITLALPVLDVNADADTNVVSGHAPPYSEVELDVYGQFYSWWDYVQVDGSGAFSLIPPDYDVLHLDNAYLYWYNEYNDYVIANDRVEGIGGDISQDDAWGYLPSPAPDVTVTLYGPGGLKASQVVDVNETYFYTQKLCNGGYPADIAAGDTLSADSLSVNIPDIQATLDPAFNYIFGTAPAGARLFIYPYTYDGSWIYYNFGIPTFIEVDSSGTFVVDYAAAGLDIRYGDYANITWVSAEGDRAYQTVYTIPQAGIQTAITSYPAAARPNAPVFLEWSVNGGTGYYSTYLLWDTESHACDRNYTHGAGWLRGGFNEFTASLLAPAAGTIYVAPLAYVNGYQVWGPEIAIPVSEIAPLINDPVNGTTNTATPVLHGFAQPGATVKFFRQTLAGQPEMGVQASPSDISLGSTTADLDGTFVFTMTTPLASGAHGLYARVEGQNTNLLALTVDTSLLVDPNHIFFYSSGNRYRIHDDQGYANLGGHVWFRPDQPVEAEIPIACSNVTDAMLVVGSGNADLIETRPGVWGGIFQQPNNNYAIVASFTCNGTPQSILLTYGLIDPDGFVFDGRSYYRLGGAVVTCQQWDAATSSFVPWDAMVWDQVNPQFTDESGYYSFIVPPGTYRIQVSRSGYFDYLSPDLVVSNAPVHHNAPLDGLLEVHLPLVRR